VAEPGSSHIHRRLSPDEIARSCCMATLGCIESFAVCTACRSFAKFWSALIKGAAEPEVTLTRPVFYDGVRGRSLSNDVLAKEGRSR